MGSSRKRVRTKPPKVDDETQNTVASVQDQPDGTIPGESAVNTEDTLGSLKNETKSTKQVKSKGSWYGTWPRKSSASTQIARETILADKPKNGSSSADLSRFEQQKPPVISDGRPPSMLLGKSKETSIVSMEGSKPTSLKDDTNDTTRKAEKGVASDKPETTTGESVKQNEATEPKPTPPSPPNPETIQRPSTSAGWLGGWLGRPAMHDVSTCPRSEDPSLKAPEEQPLLKPAEVEAEAPKVPEEDQQATPVPAVANSWFSLWLKPVSPPVVDGPVEEIPVSLTHDKPDTVMEDAPPTETEVSSQPAAGSSWAFWSTTAPTKEESTSIPSKDSGQLAVQGKPSETQPEPAKTVTVKDDKKGKRNKSKTSDIVDLSNEITSGKKTVSSEPQAAKAHSTPTSSLRSVKVSPPNLLMPSVKETYKLMDNPSILQQLAQLLLRGHQKPVRHVYLAKDPPKIRKALAIGIHGLFPAPLLRTVIGQPTGTSIRFANHAAAAIRRWGDQHGCANCEIEKIALEGEGKIAERVDNLWKLLLNWIDHVRSADFIMVACHSQGVPVALMLIAKLVEFGVVSIGRIGVCAMAGVSLGPFADYKSRLFSGSAGELFEFADPASEVSKKYEHALRIALKYGVRVTFCGSIDDQLVSMESSIFSSASHPHIYRAVFVDGRIHAPNFLSHLIGFALKLRNLGVSDHGLIRELSAPLAGSLYSGEGHSRLYDDERVYDLAIEYTLETTSVGDVPLDLAKYEVPTNVNPYVLPWIMRGLLEEDFVKTELDAEVTTLLEQFDDWKPTTKVLKDVKYRLEAVRSKL